MNEIEMIILFTSSITILLGIYSNKMNEQHMVDKYFADALIFSLNTIVILFIILLYIRSQFAITPVGKMTDIKI
jgi:hypothetical protein